MLATALYFALFLTVFAAPDAGLVDCGNGNGCPLDRKCIEDTTRLSEADFAAGIYVGVEYGCTPDGYLGSEVVVCSDARFSCPVTAPICDEARGQCVETLISYDAMELEMVDSFTNVNISAQVGAMPMIENSPSVPLPSVLALRGLYEKNDAEKNICPSLVNIPSFCTCRPTASGTVSTVECGFTLLSTRFAVAADFSPCLSPARLAFRVSSPVSFSLGTINAGFNFQRFIPGATVTIIVARVGARLQGRVNGNRERLRVELAVDACAQLAFWSVCGNRATRSLPFVIFAREYQFSAQLCTPQVAPREIAAPPTPAPAPIWNYVFETDCFAPSCRNCQVWRAVPWTCYRSHHAQAFVAFVCSDDGQNVGEYYFADNQCSRQLPDTDSWRTNVCHTIDPSWTFSMRCSTTALLEDVKHMAEFDSVSNFPRHVPFANLTDFRRVVRMTN